MTHCLWIYCKKKHRGLAILRFECPFIEVFKTIMLTARDRIDIEGLERMKIVYKRAACARGKG